MVAAMFAVAVALCMIPLVIVLCIRKARRSGTAWFAASIPLMALVAYCFLVWRGIDADNDLYAAVERRDLNHARMLLKDGIPPDASDLEGQRVILVAISNRDWPMVKLLIDAGAHNADSGDDKSDESSAAARLDDAGHRDWAAILRKRGYD